MLTQIDDEQIAAIRDHALSIRKHRSGPMSHAIDISPLAGPLPPCNCLTVEIGPCGSHKAAYSVRLSPLYTTDWSKHTTHIQLPPGATPEAAAEWPIRLVNDPYALLANPDSTHCLPPGGIELDFKALLERGGASTEPTP
jgi:hypothetical protein